MTKFVIAEEVDIYKYPAMAIGTGITDVTAGDLHANAIYLLYFLIRNGVCDIPPAAYGRLVEIYQIPVEDLTKELLAEFNALIDSIKIGNPEMLFRLIGDEVGDRGVCDYYTLKILQRLREIGAKGEILFSNHGNEFITGYERFAVRKNTFESTFIDDSQTVSLTSLNDLIARGLITIEELHDMIDTAYKPMLKAISYSLDPATNGITIYSHAGIGLQSIQALAKRFSVEYKDSTSLELAATIDKINETFSKSVFANKLNESLSDIDMLRGARGFISFREDNALEFIIFNRKYSDPAAPSKPYLNRPLLHNGYPISFAHGHDSMEPTKDNIFVLEGILGKSLEEHRGTYISLVSDELQLSPAEKPSVVDVKALAMIAAKHGFFSAGPGGAGGVSHSLAAEMKVLPSAIPAVAGMASA